MVKAIYHHVKVSGIVTVVPDKFICLDDEVCYYDGDVSKINRLKNTVGLDRRAVSPTDVTAADYCEQAARLLLEGCEVSVNEIDAIIFVSDAADYKCPPTSCVLHGKLDLPLTCMALDINHGCAGYVYGLNIASALIENKSCRKILLLVGDTKSKTINIKDRVSAPIFGDGGAATLLEYSEKEALSYYILGAEGKKYDNIIIPAGGARLPCSQETAQEFTDEFGNVRNLNNFCMNGRNVFDFTMTRVPHCIKEMFNFANVQPNDIDYAVFHQANKSIINNIAGRVGFGDVTKIPVETLVKYGNLAVASIPSVINDQLRDVLNKTSRKTLLAGFGVGLSWGVALLELGNLYCPAVFEYKGEKSE